MDNTDDKVTHQVAVTPAQPKPAVSASILLRERLQDYKYVPADVPVGRSPRSGLRSGRLRALDETHGVKAEAAGVKREAIETSTSPSPVKRARRDGATIRSPMRSPSKPASGSPSRSVTKSPRTSSKYAAPSRYAHLNPLTDVLADNLLLVFVGVNPGISTAVAGHAYAHPSNRFWPILHASGLTPERRLSHTEDRDLPRLYGYGNTNIVERPTKDQGELSKAEMTAGTAALDEKFRRHKPEAVCIVGKGIWEAIWRFRYGRNITKAEFSYGWQDEQENMGRSAEDSREVEVEGRPWNGARVFVATSTSGQAAFLRPEEKLAIWKPLGQWAQRRRKERTEGGITTGSVGFERAQVKEEST